MTVQSLRLSKWHLALAAMTVVASFAALFTVAPKAHALSWFDPGCSVTTPAQGFSGANYYVLYKVSVEGPGGDVGNIYTNNCDASGAYYNAGLGRAGDAIQLGSSMDAFSGAGAVNYPDIAFPSDMGGSQSANGGNYGVFVDDAGLIQINGGTIFDTISPSPLNGGRGIYDCGTAAAPSVFCSPYHGAAFWGATNDLSGYMGRDGSGNLLPNLHVNMQVANTWCCGNEVSIIFVVRYPPTPVVNPNPGPGPGPTPLPPPPPPPPPPTPGVDLKVNGADGQAPDIYPGQPINITWSSSNVDNCDASGDWSGNGIGTGGGASGDSSLQGLKTYVITCSGPYGTTSDQGSIRVIPPPPIATCGNATSNPGIPAPSENFSVTVSFSFSPPSAVGRSYTVSMSMGGVTGPGSTTATVTDPPGAGSLLATFNGLKANSSGTKTGTFTLTGGDGVTLPAGSCPVSVSIARQPYIRAYGADMLTGYGYKVTESGGGCLPNDESHFITFNRGDPNYEGSGSQLGIFSSSNVYPTLGFVSAMARNNPGPPKDLTFANTGPGVEGSTYGGGWGSGTCAPDFFADATGTLPGGTIITGRTLGPGQKETIYVDGDTYIDGNIVYANQAYNPADIPSFRIIVRGRLFIGPNVTELHGTYITQPTYYAGDAINGIFIGDAGTGRIFTCGINESGSFRVPYNDPAGNELINTCNKKLTVIGAMIAYSFRFLRTNGSLANATANENYKDSSIAESFLYTPAVWLTIPGGSGSTDNTGYDAINALPPIL